MKAKGCEISNIGIVLTAALSGFVLATGIFEFITGWSIWRSIISIIVGLSGIIVAIRREFR
jgi:hypothetical protein